MPAEVDTDEAADYFVSFEILLTFLVVMVGWVVVVVVCVSGGGQGNGKRLFGILLTWGRSGCRGA